MKSTHHKTGLIENNRVDVGLPHNPFRYRLKLSSSLAFRSKLGNARNRQMIALFNLSLSRECFGIGIHLFKWLKHSTHTFMSGVPQEEQRDWPRGMCIDQTWTFFLSPEVFHSGDQWIKILVKKFLGHTWLTLFTIVTGGFLIDLNKVITQLVFRDELIPCWLESGSELCVSGNLQSRVEFAILLSQAIDFNFVNTG